MPAWTVSLFFSLTNHIAVYCHMFILLLGNCRAQVAGHGNSVQLMFAAIGQWPELLGWALRRLAVVGPVSLW